MPAVSFANLGAVVDIILIVVGLDQNEAMMRAQTRHELSAGIVDLFARVAENPQLASLRQRDASAAYARRSPAVVRFWCAHRSEFSPEFADEFDRLLPAGSC
jgi:hypothetical protein